MSIITPSTAIDLSKLEERDWPTSLEMLDWDSTSVMFTKRSLIEFLNRYTGITVDLDLTNIAKLPRYAKFGKMTPAEATAKGSTVKADSDSVGRKKSHKASHHADMSGHKDDGYAPTPGSRRGAYTQPPNIWSGTTASESTSQGRGTTKNLVHHVHLTLEDLYKGKTTKLVITRNGICSKCNGKDGVEDGAARPACNQCGGRGTKVSLRQIGSVIQQVQSPCEHCHGKGGVIKERCAMCKGNKVLSEKKTLEVNIDKGMKAGQKIEFRGETDRSPNAEPGDVIVVIDEKPHDRFRRQGDNLITKVEVDLLTALGGGQFAIKHLDGRALIMRIEPGEIGKRSGMKVVRGQGMPSQQHHEPGDLHIKINVKFPRVPKASILLLERALPPRIPIERFEKDVVLEEVTLDDTDSGSEDEETDDGDEERVQCQNQ